MPYVERRLNNVTARARWADTEQLRQWARDYADYPLTDDEADRVIAALERRGYRFDTDDNGGLIVEEPNCDVDFREVIREVAAR